jgi:hypothetical protein
MGHQSASVNQECQHLVIAFTLSQYWLVTRLSRRVHETVESPAVPDQYKVGGRELALLEPPGMAPSVHRLSIAGRGGQLQAAAHDNSVRSS